MQVALTPRKPPVYPGNGGAHSEQMDTHYNIKNQEDYSDNDDEDEENEEAKVRNVNN